MRNYQQLTRYYPKEVSFIESIWPLALKIESTYNIPRGIIIAQAALATDFGRNILGNNYFLIEGLDNTIKIEENDGKTTKIVDKKIATYNSIEDSFEAYGKELSKAQYKECFLYTDDLELFAYHLKKSLYSFDFNYDKKIIDILKRYKLMYASFKIRPNIPLYQEELNYTPEKKTSESIIQQTFKSQGSPINEEIIESTPLIYDELTNNQISKANFELVDIIRVVDGDTIVVASSIMEPTNPPNAGTHVRLVGINAPEIESNNSPREEGALESKLFLEEIIKSFKKDNKVLIEWGISEHHKYDNYGRNLGVLYLKNKNSDYINANKTMLRNHHAKHFPYKGDHEDIDEFADVLSHFNDHDLLLWSKYIYAEDIDFDEDLTDFLDSLTEITDNYDNRDKMLGPLSEYSLRIGDSQFEVPPTSIYLGRQNASEQIPALRQRGSFLKKDGQADTLLEIDLFFSGKEDINGIKLDKEYIRHLDGENISYEELDLDYPYYVNGLRSLIAQFIKTPFLPIENKTINEQFKIFAVGLVSMSTSTVTGFPDALKVTLKLINFDISMYMPDALFMSDKIVWPLFRWYYQKSMQKYSTDYHTYLSPIHGDKISDKFQFGYVPTSLESSFKYLDSGDIDISKNQSTAYLTYAMIARIRDQEKMPETEFQKRAWDMSVIKEALAQRKNAQLNTGLFGERKMRLHKWQFYYQKGINKINPFKKALNEYKDELILVPLKSNEMKVFGTQAYKTPRDLLIEGFKYCTQDDLYYFTEAQFDLLLKKNKEWDLLVNGYLEQINLTEEDLPVNEFPIEDLTLQSMSIHLENVITTLRADSKENPICQYLGGQDTIIHANFKATSEDAIEKLNELWSYSMEVSRKSDQESGALMTGLIKFDTELTKVFGVTHVLIDKLDISTVLGSPGTFNVSISMIEFKKSQRKALEMDFISGNPDNDPTALTHFSDSIDLLQHKMLTRLSELSTYPDLELPHQSDLKRFLLKLGIGADWIHYHNGKYVEPDFYMTPSKVDAQSLIKSLVSENWEQTKETNESYKESEILKKEKVINDLNEELQKFENRINQTKKERYYGHETTIRYFEGEAEKIRSEIANKEKELNDYKEASHSPNPLNLLLGSPKTLEETFQRGLPKGLEESFGKSYQYIDEETGEVLPFSLDREDMKGFYHDFIRYDKRGRLARAFPTFQLIIVDEGQQIGVRKLFDNLYGIKGVFDINVHRSRTIAADMATITFADPFNRLNSVGHSSNLEPADYATHRISPTVWGELNITPSLMRERALERFRLHVREGARIHLRMGYGSDITTFPTLFNGKITEMGIGEVIQIVAQSDAIELTNIVIEKEKTKNWFIDHGSEPQNWIIGQLANRNGRFKEFFKTQSSGFLFNEDSEINHYGRTNYKNSTFRGNKELAKISLNFDDLVDETILKINSEIEKLNKRKRREINKTILKEIDKEIKYNQERIHKIQSSRPKLMYEDLSLIVLMSSQGILLEDAIDKVLNNDFTLTEEDLENISFWYENSNPLDFRKTQSGWLPGEIADNIWKANKAMNFTEKNSDEPNVRLNTVGKTLWDSIQGMAYSVPDYIAASHPFGFRSTLFYGRPHWLFAYEYEDSYIKQPNTLPSSLIRELANNDSIKSSMSNSHSRQNLIEEAWRKSNLKYKPYMQIHFYNSYSDLLVNELKASSMGVFTKTKASATVGSKPYVQEMYADKNINTSDIRVAQIETDLRIQKLTGYGKDAVFDFGANTQADFLRNMYQGTISILGDPSLKPHDMIGLDDRSAKMNGPAKIRSVTQVMSFMQGFITIFEPEPCVNTEDEFLAQLPESIATFNNAILSTTIGAIAVGSSALLLYLIASKIPPDLFSGFLAAVRGAQFWQWLSTIPPIIQKNVGAALSKFGSLILSGQGAISRISTKLVLTSMKIGSFLNTVSQGMSAFASSIVGIAIIKVAIVVVITAALAFLGWHIFTSIKSYRRRKKKSEQCCVMTLLSWRNEPFKAGISGHSGLVFGEKPKMIHKIWYKPQTWFKNNTISEFFSHQQIYSGDLIDSTQTTQEFIQDSINELGEHTSEIVDTHSFFNKYSFYISLEAQDNVLKEPYTEINLPQVSVPDLTNYNNTIYEIYNNLRAKTLINNKNQDVIPQGTILNAYLYKKDPQYFIINKKPENFLIGHFYGRALDIQIMQNIDWIKNAYNLGFNGIGYNKNNGILHVDLMVNDQRNHPFYFVNNESTVTYKDFNQFIREVERNIGELNE